MKYSEYIDTDGKMSEQAKNSVRAGITDLASAVSRTAHAHGWWSDNDGAAIQRNFGEMIALMHSELSEALEAYRDNEPVLWYQHTTFVNGEPRLNNADSEIAGKPTVFINAEGKEVIGKPCGIASEFADVIIRILDTCKTLEIPLAQALLDKAEYNRSRPYRHGGKRC